MDYSVYLDPEFDPSDLRVVDLKKALDELDVDYPSRVKKADLVSIFREEGLPRIEAKSGLEKRKKEQKVHKASAKKVSKEGKVTKTRKPSKKTAKTHRSPSKESKATLEKLLESQRSPRKTSTLKAQLKAADEPLHAKRKREPSSSDEDDIYKEFSTILNQPVNRKDHFSSGEPTPRKERKTNNGGFRKATLFPRGGEIKFDVSDEADEPETPKTPKKATPKRKSSSRKASTRKTSTKSASAKNAKDSETVVVPKVEDFPEVPSHIPSSPYNEESGSSIVYNPNATQYRSANEENLPRVPITPLKEYLQSPKKMKEIMAKYAPSSYPNVKRESPKESPRVQRKTPSRRVSSKKTNDFQKKPDDSESYSDWISDSSSDHAEKERLEVKKDDKAQDDDSIDDVTVLKQLQEDIEIETSRVEEESKKVMKSIETGLPARNDAVYKFVAAWVTLLLCFIGFAAYREQRVSAGFCGHEIYKPLFEFNRTAYPTLAEWANATESRLKLDCVPCPEHGICGFNSSLSCMPDYTVSKPWYSGFGLIPTYDICVLDAEKMRKISMIVKTSCNVLAQRNADYKCGLGEDEDVGLSFDTLQNYVVQSLGMSEEYQNGEFDYLWGKALETMEDKSELSFNDNYVRSNSLSKLSYKCKVQRLVIDVWIGMRWYIVSLSIAVYLLFVIYLKICRYQDEREKVKTLTEEVLQQLQKQATLYRDKLVQNKYIGKIQLRDYYLNDPSVSQKRKNQLWDKVTRNVEKNSNVHSYALEVNGEIMQVWEWTSDI